MRHHHASRLPIGVDGSLVPTRLLARRPREQMGGRIQACRPLVLRLDEDPGCDARLSRTRGVRIELDRLLQSLRFAASAVPMVLTVRPRVLSRKMGNIFAGRRTDRVAGEGEVVLR
jgi:hypothetical protein